MKRSYEEMLQQAGLRVTRQRILILSLLENEGRPLTVEEIVQKGKNRYDTATAYRTLDAFLKKGLVRRVEVNAGHALYEVADGVHHHHAVCTSCGTIRDVSVCIPKSLDTTVRRSAQFSSLSSHRLEFFGTCAQCVPTP